MAIEPRKPRYTNLKVLGGVNLLGIIVGILGTFAGVMSLPMVVIGFAWFVAFVGFAVAYITRREISNLVVWQQAQWVDESSIIETVEMGILRFRAMTGSLDLPERRSPVKVALRNGRELKLSWVLFSEADPSDRVSYRTRVIDGVRVFENISAGF